MPSKKKPAVKRTTRGPATKSAPKKASKKASKKATRKVDPAEVVPSWEKKKAKRARDARLPKAGTKLTRVFDEKTHTVTVHADHFVYGGKEYTSLSTIAKQITGTSWNGFSFFGLQPAAKKAA